VATPNQTLHQITSKKAFEWPRDPLQYRAEFPLHATYYALGFPLEISTNSVEVIAAAEESWGAFPKLYSNESVHLRIGVAQNGQDELPRAPILRAQRNMITIISDAENFAVCDVTGGFAFSWITPGMIADRAFFRYHFLDLMTGLLLTPKHFAIIHAACVALDGRGVLLCGHSGAGKSTLAFACGEQGWTFISDDAAYAPRKNPSRTVLGNPLYLRLREDAPDIFGQLRGRPVVRRQNGEQGFEILTDSLPGFATAFQCEIHHIVFLNRGDFERAELSPFSRDEARRQLNDVLEYTLACKLPGEKAGGQSETMLIDREAREEQKMAVSKVLAGGVYELRYSNPRSAIDCLESLVRCRS
jgi:hypothetical protein